MAIIRVNFDTFEDGEEYKRRLNDESEANFQTFLALLSSYFQSTIDGPNYARELKAMSVALAQLRLNLESIRSDTFYDQTRADFLYQTVTSILFPKGAPDTGLGDLDFRDFLVQIIKIYFQGSIPLSMTQAVELFTGPGAIIREAFIEQQNPASGLDISDEFSFAFDVILPSPGSIDVISADRNIKTVLGIIRPAHTLYRIKYILKDAYVGQLDVTHDQKITDTFSFVLSNYGYEDFRKFVTGVNRIDPLGSKKSVPVIGEDHSGDF
jgi:hypothetical protein